MHLLRNPSSVAAAAAVSAAALAAWVAAAPGWAGAGVSLESAVAQSGRDYYLRYCASCHGFEADGAGPVAPALNTKPSDLRRIAERHKGEFPMDEIAKFIDGRDLPPSHGTREMPVWGERLGRDFQGDPVRDQVIRGQLLMLLVYLQSIQR